MTNTLQLLYEAVTASFILKALLVGVLVAVSSSFLGIFLVLKKFSLIGDGLAHVSFATIALALLLSPISYFNQIPFSIFSILLSVILVILASLFILKLIERAHIHGDAAIGLVSSFSVALGVMIASLAHGFNVDLFSYLFGNILLVSNIDVYFSIGLSIVVIFTVIFFYNSLFAITYDEEFSKVIGLKTKLLNFLIAILTSITIVLGIRVVGTMLISSLIIFPTVTALQFAKGFKQTIIFSTLISVVAVIIGVFSSIVFNLPTGATIVFINGILFMIGFGLKSLANLK